MRTPLYLLALLAALLWHGAWAEARAAHPDIEAARQAAAAAADDSAFSSEGRRAALEKLQEAARLFLGAGESAEAARVLHRAGRLQLLLHEPRAALDTHRQALDLLRGAPAEEAEVDNLNGLAAAQMVLNEWDEAEKVLRRSLALSERAGYVLGQARALLTLSARQNKDQHMAALATAQSALRLWQTLEDKAGLARAFAVVGECYMAQNALAEAAQNYEVARQIWQALGNAAEQAEALTMLGYIETRNADWQSAISHFTRARALLDETAEPFKAGQIATGLADAFTETGLPASGLDRYREAREHYRRAQFPLAVAYATWSIGRTHLFLGDHAAALTHLREALAAMPPGSIYEALCRDYIGRVHLAAGEHDAALRQLEPALNIYTRAGNHKEAAQVRALLGQVYQQRGELARARQHYRQALSAFRRMSDRINEAAVYYALGQMELKQGDYGAAEEYLRQSVEVTENIRRVPTSSDLAAAFSATVHGRYELYVECLMRRHEGQPSGGHAVRAFETSDMARARSISELLRATQTILVSGLNLDRELAARATTLRQALRVKEDRRVALLAKPDKKKELAALEASLAELEAEYKQVFDNLRARHPSFGQIVQPAAWDLKRIQERVVADDETVLLEYGLGEERSHVWVVTRDGFKSYELPARQRIEEAASKVYKSLSAPPGVESKAELGAATRALARMVLAPVASELNRRRLIVVADGALNYIPFQVLPSPTDRDEPLVAGHEIVNTPSASLLGELREEAARRRPAAKTLAAFGDPVFESDFYARGKDADGGGQQGAAPSLAMARWHQASRDIELDGDAFDLANVQSLFYAKRELAHLRDMAGAETFVAAEFDANRARLLGTDLTEYAILHFATHGLLDPRQPENSGLLLSTVDRDGRAQEGFIGLQDIYGLRAPVNLVVLSACQTGLGKDVRGEGLLGLTRGFMYAGASGVVASLWKVDDEATAELMRQFYSNMVRAGMTPAAALREAQNSIRQRPEWRAPYYWAAFTLQGESRPIVRPAPAPRAASPYLKAAGGVSLFMLLAGFTWWRYGRRRTRTAPARG